jgi:DNA-binding XRE family transcriptional regulator
MNLISMESKMHKITDVADLKPLIKTLRKQAGLSQTALASFADLSRTAIQALESGKETSQIDTLLKVLNVLNARLYIDHPLFLERNDA